MAITVKRYNTAPRQIGAGRIDPGFANPLIRDASQNGTRDLVDAMLKAGMQITEVGIREYVKSESTAVSEALQEYRESLAAERERYTKANQGKNAVNAGAHFDQFARETAGPLAERFSGRFKEMFLKDAAAQGLHFAEQGRAYGNQQRQAWEKSVFDGDMAQTMNEIAADPTNAEYVHASLTALKERHAMMFPGLDQRAFEADVNRKVAGLTIDSLLAKDNISGARTALGEYRELLGVAAPQYEARILAAGRAAQARAESAQRKAEEQQILAGAQQVLVDTRGLPPAQRESAIMESLSGIEDAALRDKMWTQAKKELAFEKARTEAADGAAAYGLVTEGRKANESPLQFQMRVNSADVSEKARKLAQEQFNGKIEENELNMRALSELRGKIDAANRLQVPLTTDDVFSFAYDRRMTTGQTKAALKYLDEGGNLGALKQSAINSAWKELNPGKKDSQIPPWLFEAVQLLLPSGKDVNPAELRRITAQAIMKGTVEGRVWGNAWRTDMPYGEALTKGRAGSFEKDEDAE